MNQPSPQRQRPIEIKVNVDQNVRNVARARSSADTIPPMAAAPAAGFAGSPGLVVPFAPAPAAPPVFPAAAGSTLPVEPLPSEAASRSPPPGVVEAPVPEVEVPEVALG